MRAEVPTLIYKPGHPDERTFEIGAAAVVIGRAEEHAICIPDKSLSRSHARIEPDGDAWYLVDLASKNGTFVNGVKVARRELRQGDTLVLGDIALMFAIAGDARTPDLTAGPRPRVVRPLTRIPIAQLTREPALRESSTVVQDRVRILLEVAKLLSGREDVDVLLGRILDLAFQMLDVDRGAVLLVNEETKTLEPRVTKQKRSARDVGTIYSQRVVDYVVDNSVAAVFADAAADPRLDAAQSVIFQSIRACMCVPLKPRDEVIGVLYLDNLTTPNCFPEQDLEFLVAFASQAAIAIDNASLNRRIEREAVSRTALVMDAKVAALNALVAGIAHEIRNPLNFIANFAELSSDLVSEAKEGVGAARGRLGEGEAAGLGAALDELAENTARIIEHARRADAIIKAMLSHARQGSGDREVVDIGELVAESLKLALGARHRDLDVEVVTTSGPPAGVAEITRGEVSRVLINVIENALYAMAERKAREGAAYAPRIEVRATGLGDRVEIRICDNGTGIAPEIADRIYNPFFTTKPPGEGTGLGLSLSHDIVVHGHQGSIRMSSIPGERTEFVIMLPRKGLPKLKG